MSDEIYKAISKLRPKQRDALGQIMMNSDGFIHPATCKALLAKGLVEEHEQVLGGRFSVRIKRYTMPLRVNIAYCQWCSDHLSEDDLKAIGEA